MVGCVRRTFEEYDLKELAGESPKKIRQKKKWPWNPAYLRVIRHGFLEKHPFS